MHPGLIKLNSK